tara:strand:- start:657 stop:791 length:135 start_codon:yes stop_codon:yes gene_type:complete
MVLILVVMEWLSVHFRTPAIIKGNSKASFQKKKTLTTPKGEIGG